MTPIDTRGRTASVRCQIIALVLAIILVAALPCATGPAIAQQNVDLELVLAVDVSYSMDLEEQQLQRDGYVEAFRDPEIIRAIQNGRYRRIAVIYIEWAGWQIQQIVVPWTVIDGSESAEALAVRLKQAPISRHRRTSLSGALDFSERQFGSGGITSDRRVIDVSGDGPNNSGPPVGPMRDELVGKGIVINGLPILVKPGGPGSMFDIANLDQYYATCVIGGPGAFMIPIRDKSEFASATKQKLLLEIAGLEPPPRLTHVADGPKFDCTVGEQLWRQYFDDRLRE
ncbi:MAG: DUF1194 domain-containing protein [Hyphomicrobiaceae bacterium]